MKTLTLYRVSSHRDIREGGRSIFYRSGGLCLSDVWERSDLSNKNLPPRLDGMLGHIQDHEYCFTFEEHLSKWWPEWLVTDHGMGDVPVWVVQMPADKARVGLTQVLAPIDEYKVIEQLTLGEYYERAIASVHCADESGWFIRDRGEATSGGW